MAPPFSHQTSGVGRGNRVSSAFPSARGRLEKSSLEVTEFFWINVSLSGALRPPRLGTRPYSRTDSLQSNTELRGYIVGENGVPVRADVRCSS
jgi:hypothetical protein